ncbi:MAG: Transcriptional regulator, MarR family [uncultured Sulfurovum sp.]|uniref:Transcriptional regulator, MarR family n=1 Tax=uncultured Sulfurovum sp. TaxID=269237 RepID=A0A6S6S2S1_9BACT|nr:MAG: Transcriptional regulator, MarR family [uncultured Sulfurovum sp.]
MKKENLDNFYENVFKDEREVLGLCIPITMIHKQLFNEGSALLLEKFDLSSSEMDVLASLTFNNETLTPTDLYESTIFSSGGMTKLLKKLETKGYVSRSSCAEDKRSKLVHIEPKGVKLVHEALGLLIHKDNEFFSVLDEEEKKVFFRVLKKLLYRVVER